MDRNDNDPVMAQRVYDVAVSESAPLGSEIVKVVANDPDENSELRYEIVSGNVGNVFSISMHQVNTLQSTEVAFLLLTQQPEFDSRLSR